MFGKRSILWLQSISKLMYLGEFINMALAMDPWPIVMLVVLFFVRSELGFESSMYHATSGIFHALTLMQVFEPMLESLHGAVLK